MPEHYKLTLRLARANHGKPVSWPWRGSTIAEPEHVAAFHRDVTIAKRARL
jgi:hypothetical protein